MKIKNGNRYESNYARAAAYFLGTCAPRPAEDERAAAFDLITVIYSSVMREPEKCGLRPLPDVWFDRWETQRGREDDVKTMRDPIKKLDALIAELYRLVSAADAEPNGLIFGEGCKKPSKALVSALGEAGARLEKGRLALADGCAAGLKELAETARSAGGQSESREILYFSRCVFDPEQGWIAAAFDSTLGADGELIRLCEELEKRGYERVDCRDGNKITLDYVKRYGKKTEPVKMSWADKTHCGIELSYEDLKLEPFYIWLRTADFRRVLENCAGLPENAADFLMKNVKNCGGCRYCVQTDKTGTRPLAAVPVKGEKKCPYFPAFALNWRSLSPETARDMLALLDAAYPDGGGNNAR